MREVYRNIFEETIVYPGQYIIPRNLLVVKQPGRSLMVDAAMCLPQDRKFVQDMLRELEIDYGELDIFITHDHPDHTGLVPELEELGARVFMNPAETMWRADLLHCYLSDDRTRRESLRIVGVTRQDTPEVYDAIMDYTNWAYMEWRREGDFPFIPAPPGTVLAYGEYRFQVVPMKGHTYGQCGLYEPEHKLLFCGDQIMTNIVPNVGSQQKDLGLLKSYLKSMEEMKHKYGDCLYLTAHYGPIEDIGREVDRIVLSYMDKCTSMKRVLEEAGRPLTTREVGVRAYGRSLGPPDYQHFLSCTQIWIKTFSCLEYMYGEGLLERGEEDGILYWSIKT